MTRANGECLVVNDSVGVYGFMFSPDFDTSQQMYISRFIKNFYSKENEIVKTSYEYNGLTIPILLMGKKAKSFIDKIDEIVRPNIDFTFAERDVTNINEMKSATFGEHFVNVELDGNNYYMCTKKNFFVYVYDADCLAFVLNPYVYICEENELMQNKKYIDGYMRLKGHKCYAKSYLDNMIKRRAAYLKEFDNIFSKIETMANENGFVVGSGSMFLNTGYLVLVGTKEDSKNCLERDLFPYSTKDSCITRKTNEELDKIEKDKIEYERKCAIVDKRLDFIEKLLKEKGLHWTIISRGKINFDENDVYSTWMNAQAYDDAAYGWYKEQDFIDWLNMEGKIPFKRGQVKYFGKMLEEVSNGQYIFVGYEPIEKSSKLSVYDDYDVVGIFKQKDNKNKTHLDLLKIKEIIETYTPIVKYTMEDFERDFNKSNKKGFFDKIKNIVKRA